MININFMYASLAFNKVLGIPIIVWGGAITFGLFIAAAIVGYLILKGKTTIPMKWHFYLAGTALLFGLFHAIFGILAFAG